MENNHENQRQIPMERKDPEGLKNGSVVLETEKQVGKKQILSATSLIELNLGVNQVSIWSIHKYS